MKQLIVVLILTSCLLLPIAASGADADLPVYAGFGGFTLGVGTMPASELNSRFEEVGADGFSMIFPTLGFRGTAYVFERVVLGASIFGSQQHVTGDDLTANLSLVNASFDFGYIVYQTSGLLLYPLLNLGWGGIYLDVAGDTSELNFIPPRLKSSNDDFLLTRGAMTTMVGVRADYLFKLYRQSYIFGGLALSASLGYKYTPFITAWYDEGHQSYLQGGPDMNFNGAYFEFGVSFGGGKDKYYTLPTEQENN
ncbi:MAG: hypothetical protein P9M14_02950 [Candidatus Alcyoniella australis]|nr:hypothetical protein [Candidatus Alcyoniella australis]